MIFFSIQTMYSLSRNVAIQYLPMPMTDIIIMRTTEKERMEKLQQLMNKVIEHTIKRVMFFI
jgi:predicted solute-binding protein